MADREEIEKLAGSIRQDRDIAEAAATSAAESLMRQASGITKLADLDPDRIRAAADDFAGGVERFKLLSEVATRVRQILM